eukprot:CAMPEP_0117546246 /NCGR_PEP_ID=MMETSP0784-20121206/46509_1 /TAXON_ID=39447 /ORGANISM="" /LENGTH=73 /DNA_ID=CAMNT_0005343113 /DNA_START=478 /DNA_END=699 /DNA_ORIENTATION=+
MRGHGLELLLASGVPDLEGVLLVSLHIDECLLEEGDSDSRLRLRKQDVVDEAVDQRRLPDRRITDEHDFHIAP